MRFTTSSLTVLTLAMLLTGCGGSGQTSAENAPEAGASEPIASASAEAPGGDASADPSQPVGSSSEETDLDESDSADEDSSLGGESPDPDSTPGGSVLGESKKGQQLGLADFFNPDISWTENRYSVAGESDIRGISKEINNCGKRDYDDSGKLELRLGRNFETLNFKVGQSDYSDASDQTLVAHVQGNNKQIDIWRIPFDTIQEFSIPVSDVNALTVDFYLDEEANRCGRSGSVQAVMYDVELQ